MTALETISFKRVEGTVSLVVHSHSNVLKIVEVDGVVDGVDEVDEVDEVVKW